MLTHLLGDFVFQNDRLCELKKDRDIKQRLKGVSGHIVIIFFTNIVVFALTFKDIPIIAIFLISLFHWFLDMLKSTLESKEKINNWKEILFFADQGLHFISIFIAAHVLYSFNISHYLCFCSQVMSGSVTVSKSLTLSKKVLLVFIYLCLTTSVANVVVKLFLDRLRKDLGTDLKIGRYIGGVERILTISIILAGAWQALTVLYGSKTAIRFEQAKENSDFAEYYILGTTLSALFAVIIAGAVKITLL